MDQHKTTEVVIAPGKANVYAFVLFIVTLLIFGIPFGWLHGFEVLINAWRDFLSNLLLLGGCIIGGMILHEFIHAFIWALHTPGRWKDVSFGVNWKQMAPFVHCSVPLPLKPYFNGVIAPGIILGLIPLSLSLVFGNGFPFCFGTFFTAGAAGDFIAAQKLIQLDKENLVSDHPDHLGFIIHRST